MGGQGVITAVLILRTALCVWAQGWLSAEAREEGACDPGLADEAVEPLTPRPRRADQNGGDHCNSCFAAKELVLNSCPMGESLGLLMTNHTQGPGLIGHSYTLG